MKAAGCRQKGKRLEHKWAEMIREAEVDPDARRQILSGGSFLKSDINTTLPVAFECKNQESWSIPEWWKQVTADCGPKMPVLVVSRNRNDIYCFLRGKDLLELMRFAQESGGWYKPEKWKAKIKH